jgi:hypothetical protein
MPSASRVRPKCVSTKDSFLRDIREAANAWPFFPYRKEPPSFARIPVLFIGTQPSVERLKNPSEITRKRINRAETNARAGSHGESEVNNKQKIIFVMAGLDPAIPILRAMPP